MEQPVLISVIIPAFNAEKYLDRAVRSVLCQMDGSIELILVNDGSTDGTGAICDAYARGNPNVRVIHKENGGTSSAKNRGIAVARGRYLSFLDSDDYVVSSAYAQIADVIRKYAPDCLDFGWNYVDSQGNSKGNHHGVQKNVLLSRETIKAIILPPLLNLRDDKPQFIFDFACTKVFKAEIIHDYSVRFDEEKRTWEDRTFLLRHLKHCDTYYSMDCCLYNYVWMPNSLSQQYRQDIFDIILANFQHYRELYQDEFDFDTDYANRYRCRAIENMIFRSLEQTENREIIVKNVASTLKNEKVVYWYANRTAKDAFEEKVNQLVRSGNVEAAIQLYEQERQRRQKSAARKQLLSRAKGWIKRVLGR